MKIVKEGIRQTDGAYVFDYNKDELDDIVHLSGPEIYESQIDGNTYWFGYKFTDTSNRKQRNEFIKYLKGIGEQKPTEDEYNFFISKPLKKLFNEVGFNNFGCVVYPKSKVLQ